MASEGPTSVQDAESQESPQRGVRKLDVCIFISLLLLAAALAGGGGAVYLLLPHHHHPHHEQAPQGSAHFIADKVDLNNGLRTWLTGPHTGGLMQGPDLRFHNSTHPLLVNKDGVYYIYAQMALRCVQSCNKEEQVKLTIYRVDDQNLETEILAMSILLPSTSGPTNTPVQTKFSATLVKLSEHNILFARMEVMDKNSDQWQLDSRKSNFLGIFPASRSGLVNP